MNRQLKHLMALSHAGIIIFLLPLAQQTLDLNRTSPSQANVMDRTPALLVKRF